MQIKRKTNGRSVVMDNGFEIGFHLAKKLVRAGDRRAPFLNQFIRSERTRAGNALATASFINDQRQRYYAEVIR